MKRILKIIIEITHETLLTIGYFLESNLRNFAIILNVILPYTAYFLGQSVAIERGKIVIGGEVIILIMSTVIIFYLKSTADKLGKGTTVPIPDKRFTEVKDDGEVSIENGRVQELILYLADLEDWLERKGLL